MTLDLEEERDFLLRSLDDLERERAAGDVAEDDYRTLHDDYTARAAAVIRAIEDGRAEGAAAPAPEPAGKRRDRRPLIGVAIVVAVAATAGLLVARSAGERRPGDTITGTAAPAGDVERDLLLQAQAAMGTDPVAALQAYDQVLAEDPDNVEALTFRGWLLYQASLTDEGLATIERALEIDPAYQEALTFRGVIRRQQGDLEGAAADFEAVLRQDPPADIAQLVATAYQEVQAQLSGSPATAPPGTAP